MVVGGGCSAAIGDDEDEAGMDKAEQWGEREGPIGWGEQALV